VQLQFFTNISHELRTPLSLIIGPIEKIQKEDPLSLHGHAYQVINKNANRLLHLINELMDFRKSESGVLKLHVMPGSAENFLEEISEEFSELAQQKKIDFKIIPGHTQTSTWFDRQIMEKIIINLIGNSFKYTPDGGVITLETFDSLKNFKPSFENELILPAEFKSEYSIYFRVADNGIGISKESIEHLFERYYRISESHMGSGIGLAFVKSLATLHKGSIHVYSEKNKGTEIIVGIPCSQNDYLKSERWLKGNEAGVKLESINSNITEQINNSKPELKKPVVIPPSILIVEDNDELRQFLKETLEPVYKISEAADGKAGFEKATEETPDLIISDIMMPVMNGIEFCRLIKSTIETSHIPFMMLTAKDGLESRIEGTETGADYYFSKPLSTELLELTIKNVFLQKQKIKDRYQKDYHTEVKELAHSVKDKEFLEGLIGVIEANLTKPEMNIDFICTQIGMSRTKLFTKIKNITGQSIGDFIRTIRLKKAAQLLTLQDMSITDVMYGVGIQTQSYFTKAFKNEFGKTPTQFLKDLQTNKNQIQKNITNNNLL
jgi:DNA-binding response OmpR family regulator